MALVGIELVTLVSEPDTLTTRPPPCAKTNCFEGSLVLLKHVKMMK